eukprot:5464642-Prymnesium_polylepis.1
MRDTLAGNPAAHRPRWCAIAPTQATRDMCSASRARHRHRPCERRSTEIGTFRGYFPGACMARSG